MAFGLEKINLDTLHEWPKPMRYGILAAFFVVVIFLGYNFFLSGKFKSIDRLKRQEAENKSQIEAIYFRIAKLEQYDLDVDKINSKFAKIIKQLPHESAVHNLLASISELALENGLSVEVFDPQTEVAMKYYAFLPVHMRLLGSYHQIASFVNGLSKMDRIVTFQSLSVTQEETKEKISRQQPLALDILINTYYQSKKEVKKDGA